MRLQITQSNVVYSSDVKDVLSKIIQLRLVKEQPWKFLDEPRNE